jgi:hypothetical protein
VKHNLVQELDGDLCHDLHDGQAIEVKLEGKKLKVELKRGKDQDTYFIEIKGMKTLNSGCTGKKFKFNGDTYLSSVLTARVKISISRETGRYNPDDGNLVLEILATHITSSSVHDLHSLDSSIGQVALALSMSGGPSSYGPWLP